MKHKNDGDQKSGFLHYFINQRFRVIDIMCRIRTRIKNLLIFNYDITRILFKLSFYKVPENSFFFLYMSPELRIQRRRSPPLSIDGRYIILPPLDTILFHFLTLHSLIEATIKHIVLENRVPLVSYYRKNHQHSKTT